METERERARDTAGRRGREVCEDKEEPARRAREIWRERIEVEERRRDAPAWRDGERFSEWHVLSKFTIRDANLSNWYRIAAWHSSPFLHTWITIRNMDSPKHRWEFEYQLLYACLQILKKDYYFPPTCTAVYGSNVHFPCISHAFPRALLYRHKAIENRFALHFSFTSR